jgi:hypothetical protein
MTSQAQIQAFIDYMKSASCSGMTYSANEEATISAKLPFMTIEEVAEYAEIVCRTCSGDRSFLEEHFSQESCEAEKKRLLNSGYQDPTSLGNLAWIATKSPEPYKSRARELWVIGIREFESRHIDHSIRIVSGCLIK